MRDRGALRVRAPMHTRPPLNGRRGTARWYRRAYYDDGTPLGTATDDECRIDAIAQSWAVLSGAGDPERARAAMQRGQRAIGS